MQELAEKNLEIIEPKRDRLVLEAADSAFYEDCPTLLDSPGRFCSYE